MKKILGLGLLVGSIVGLTGCNLDELKEELGNLEGVDRTELFDYTAMNVDKIDFSLYEGFSEEQLKTLLVKEGYLTVGTSPDYAPYSFLDMELSGLSKVQGSESAMALYVAKSLGLELEFKEIAFDGLTTQLTLNNIDVIFSGLTYSAEREENYTFTDTYYNSGDGGQVLLVNKSDLSKYTSMDKINVSSVTVAAQNGALQQELVETQLTESTIQKFSSISDGVTLLKTGKVDLMASSYTSAQAIVSENDDIVILDWFEFDVLEYGTMGLLKQNNGLVDYINLVIADFDNDTYAAWLEDYLEYADAISF